DRVRYPEGEVTIANVGKYTGLKDAYKSLIEALSHGGIANKVRVDLDWIESEVFEREDPAPFLEHVDGILVPGGFGQRGAEGKIRAAQYARERHRHRYEINTGYRPRLEQHGMRFSGMSPDGLLPEIIEYADHPWFIGVQFHPELKSRPFEPHPLFASFIEAAVVQSRLV